MARDDASDDPADAAEVDATEVGPEIRRANCEHRRRFSMDVLAGWLSGFPFAWWKRSRVDHPHAAGTDPREPGRGPHGVRRFRR